MVTEKKSKINVLGTDIVVVSYKTDDYICLTDMAKRFGGDDLIYSWMRNRNTLEFLGIWEQMHNLDFKGGGLETFKKQAGLNSFHLTPKKWIEAIIVIGIQLLVLANLESLNPELIRMNLPQNERLKKLNETAIIQLKSLLGLTIIKKLENDK